MAPTFFHIEEPSDVLKQTYDLGSASVLQKRQDRNTRTHTFILTRRKQTSEGKILKHTQNTDLISYWSTGTDKHLSHQSWNFQCACACERVCVSVRECVCVWVGVCLWVSVCVRECVSLSVSVFACACTRPKGVFTQPVCFLMFPNTVDFVFYRCCYHHVFGLFWSSCSWTSS